MFLFEHRVTQNAAAFSQQSGLNYHFIWVCHPFSDTSKSLFGWQQEAVRQRNLDIKEKAGNTWHIILVVYRNMCIHIYIYTHTYFICSKTVPVFCGVHFRVTSPRPQRLKPNRFAVGNQQFVMFWLVLYFDLSAQVCLCVCVVRSQCFKGSTQLCSCPRGPPLQHSGRAGSI